MGGAYGTHERGEKSVQCFFFGKAHSEDEDVDGSMGSEWILGRMAGVVEWIQLAQDRHRWRAVLDK
jgi:hypothetical protein